MGHCWLTDEQFSRGKARVDDCRVIGGIINVLRSGGRGIDAPAEYGPRKTLYNRMPAGRRRASGSI
jgi:transposase